MAIVFTAIDGCTKDEVTLHQVNWEKHVRKRPELGGHERSVKNTVEDPDFAVKDARGIYKFRKGYGDGPRRNCWIRVIEAETPNGTFVVSAHFTSKIRPKDAEVLCINRLVLGD